MSDFKDWLAVEEDAALIESVLHETFTQAAVEFGNIFADPANDPSINKVLTTISKVESMIGMRKFLMALPKAVYAQVMFVFAVVKFAKNPTDMEAGANVLHWLAEAGKMGVYSGATIPLGAMLGGMLMPGIGEVLGGVLAKAVSYGYFYMGQWAEHNLNNPKYGQLAQKIQALMPKSVSHKPAEPTPDQKPAPATPGTTVSQPKRPGLFARLFGRKPAAPEPQASTPAS